MSLSFVKLFNSILDSSVWLESAETRVTWITLLVSSDRDGMARFATVANLARRAGIEADAAEKAIKILESPDRFAPHQEFDGRRIERRPEGWFILNHSKYRKLLSKDDEREATRERVQRFRAKEKESSAGNGVVTDVTTSRGRGRSKSEEDAEEKAESKGTEGFASQPRSSESGKEKVLAAPPPARANGEHRGPPPGYKSGGLLKPQ